MGFLAFGILLLLLGGVLALADLLPPGPLLSPLIYTGWLLLALGTTLVVIHVAVGPPRDARLESGRDGERRIEP